MHTGEPNKSIFVKRTDVKLKPGNRPQDHLRGQLELRRPGAGPSTATEQVPPLPRQVVGPASAPCLLAALGHPRKVRGILRFLGNGGVAVLAQG